MSAESCTICGGTGWRVIERAGLSGAERCSCAQQARVEALRSAAGIPPNYEHATLANFLPPADNPTQRHLVGSALLTVRAYAREFPRVDPPGLLLTGGTGSGKTHLAIGALKAILEAGFEGVFFDYQNLLHRIYSGYDRDAGAADREAYGAALDTHVLVLDDLGSQSANDWVIDTVTSIITHRCNHRKPTIVTTNLDVGRVLNYRTEGGTEVHTRSLAEVIGARAQSRLFEMCRVVRMGGIEDYRERHAR
jgi:DNA replication protein DnaC